MSWKLISCKYVFRYDDAEETELNLYKEAMTDRICEIEDLHELFTPFTGEERTFLNTDIGTDELRIRYWIWVYEGISYDILDINSFPGDNECGIVAMKTGNEEYKIICHNGDCDLTPVENDVCPNMDAFLEFGDLRQLRNPNKIDQNQYLETTVAWWASSARKEARQIQKTAWKLYRDKYDAVQAEHNALRDKYLNEFKLIDHDSNIDLDFLDKLGYLKLRRTSYDNRYRPRIAYQKYLWNAEHEIIYINDWDDYMSSHTYLIVNGKLVEVFHDWYLSEKNIKQRIPLILKLHERVYSLEYLCTIQYRELLKNKPINVKRAIQG